MSAIQNRYDFVLLFDVQDGNPNGDPDAGNLPRVDPETGHGLVTDVCLKRKVRNFVQLTKAGNAGYDIYVREKAVLGEAHVKAFRELGIQLGEETKVVIPKIVCEWLEENEAPEGLRVESDEDSGSYILTIAADVDKKEVRTWVKETKPPKAVKDAISSSLKDAKARRPTGEEVERGRGKMCTDYFDIRAFGGVLSLKSAPNCGQVRGPVQMTFSRSIDPIVQLEHSITRMAVATEVEAEKQHGDNRTMGRKFTIPYALYKGHGFISAPLAKQTGFTEEDLSLLWSALSMMFEHDRSAARGLMTTRALVVFKHDGILGNAPAHSLFERVSVRRKDGISVPRSFSDYEVSVAADGLPPGVNIVPMTV